MSTHTHTPTQGAHSYLLVDLVNDRQEGYRSSGRMQYGMSKDLDPKNIPQVHAAHYTDSVITEYMIGSVERAAVSIIQYITVQEVAPGYLICRLTRCGCC